MVQNLIRKLIVTFSINSLFYGTSRLVTVYTKARSCNLYSIEPDIPARIFTFNFRNFHIKIIFLFTLMSCKWPFLSKFPAVNILYAFLNSFIALSLFQNARKVTLEDILCLYTVQRIHGNEVCRQQVIR
jgi:hypothetical protein